MSVSNTPDNAWGVVCLWRLICFFLGPHSFGTALENDDAATFSPLLVDCPFDILRATELAFDHLRGEGNRPQFFIA